MTATTLNTIVSLFLIGCTLLSFIFFYRTRKIHDQSVKRLNAIDLLEYTSSMDIIIREYFEMIRSTSWNIGKAENQVMRRLYEQLLKWNAQRTTISDSGMLQSLDDCIDRFILNKDYTLWDKEMSKSMLYVLWDISKHLNAETSCQLSQASIR